MAVYYEASGVSLVIFSLQHIECQLLWLPIRVQTIVDHRPSSQPVSRSLDPSEGLCNEYSSCGLQAPSRKRQPWSTSFEFGSIVENIV
jgi:hypothetical protein